MKKIMLIILFVVFMVNASTPYVMAASTKMPVKVSLSIDETEEPKKMVTVLQIVLMLTVLSLAPSILMMLTSFTRIVVILAFLKKAMGTGSQPSSQILIGLALFLTFYIMAPVWGDMNQQAIKPYMANEITQAEAFENLVKPMRKFMFTYTREKDLALFVHVAKIARPKTKDDIPTHILVPAFVMSELKTAFQMGFVLYLPFLVLDMVVASVLLSMGMMMLPPIMVSMPFKILLFVLVDGWHLIIRAITMSYR